MGYYGVKYIGKQVGVFMLDFDVFNMYPIMFFQSFSCGCDENGNRQILVLVYNLSGSVYKAYLTANERIVDELQSDGLKQLQFPNYKDRVKISQETFNEMVEHFERTGKLEYHA